MLLVEVICFDKNCFPTKNLKNDTCYDVKAFDIIKGEGFKLNKDFINNTWSCDIFPQGGRVLVHTGLQIANIPENYEIEVRPRSGLAINHGITILNSPGTIDNNYRGILGVILINTSDKVFIVEMYDRIAQIKISKIYPDIEIIETDKVQRTERDEKGFGSSGI